ncbi:MAG: MgtC/SapB family protein [Patescibacteria group bacterium]
MFTSNEVIAVLCAYVCGVILGFERTLHNRVVGIKTHALVSMGAAVFTLMAAKVGKENTLYAAVMIGGIISGIGFFARGAVMQENNGMTTNQPTAATVWISAAIGVTCGLLQLPLAFMITVIVVATTFFTEKLNQQVKKRIE